MSQRSGQEGIALVVVHYGDMMDTLACCRAIRASSDCGWHRTIIVVDNGTQCAASLEHVADIVISARTNAGYAAGCNLGISAGLEQRAHYICILNNDVVISPDALIELRAGIERCRDAWAYGGRIAIADGGNRDWYAGGRINYVLCRADHFGFNGRSGAMATDGDVSFIPGAFMLMPASTFARVGLLDETFFLYGEDVEWCRRIQRHGGTLRYLTHVKLSHRVERRLRRYSPGYLFYVTRNRIAAFGRNGWVYRCYVVVFCTLWHGAARTIVEAIRNRGMRWMTARAVLTGTLAGLQGGMGPEREYSPDA